MQWRYTTKKYNPSKKIKVTQLEELKEVLRLTPSSINSQPWRFTFVSDTTTKNKLAEASFFNAQKIIDSDTLIVFSRVNNLEVFEKEIEEILPKVAVGYYDQFIKTKPEAEIKAWFDKQVYLALGVLLSACAEMKIDSTPMEGIEPEKYNEILGLKNYTSLVGVAIGFRDKDDTNQVDNSPKSRKLLSKVVQSI